MAVSSIGITRSWKELQRYYWLAMVPNIFISWWFITNESTWIFWFHISLYIYIFLKKKICCHFQLLFLPKETSEWMAVWGMNDSDSICATIRRNRAWIFNFFFQMPYSYVYRSRHDENKPLRSKRKFVKNKTSHSAFRLHMHLHGSQ